MPYGYIGQNLPSQTKSNSGVFSISDVADLEKQGKFGGSLELIEEQNPSSETTIDFTNIQENVFDVHYMTWALNPSGDDTGLVRLSIDNGSSFVSSGYQHAEQFGDAGGTFTEFRSTSASFFARLGDSGGAGANELHNGYMYFYNLGNSGKYSFASYQTTGLDTSAVYTMMFGGAVYPTANTVNAIRLFGNIGFNFTGTVKLYGVKQI